MITARISTKEQLDELHAIITKHPKISDWYRHMGNQWIVEFDDKSLSSLNNYLGAAFEDGKRPTMLVNPRPNKAQVKPKQSPTTNMP